MLRLIILVGLVFFSTSTFAEEAIDPFAVSDRTAKEFDELGISTKQDVDALEAEVSALLSGDNCREAIPKLEEYRRRANQLSNLIAQGLEPFYGASLDKRRNFSGIRKWTKYERQANEYRAKRNQTMVMLAECQIKLGNQKEGVETLWAALDLIDIHNAEWWDRAASLLFQEIGIRQEGQF
jgi:hypothetical protein